MIPKTKSPDHAVPRVVGRALFTLLFAFLAVPVLAQTVAPSGVSRSKPSMQAYMQNLLKAYILQDKDFGTFLASQPSLTVAEGTNENIAISDLNKLPNPPNSALQSEVYSYIDIGNPAVFQPTLYLLWLPQEKIGAVYINEGSGVCLTFFLFRSDGENTIPIETPRIFKPFVCELDGSADSADGREGFIIQHGQQVYAVVFAYVQMPPLNQTAYTYTLSWEEWMNNGWSASKSVTAASTTRDGP